MRGGPGPLERAGPGRQLHVLSVPPGGVRGGVGPPSQAGGGSGAIRVMRWSPDGRSWQNSDGTVPSALRPASQVPQCCHSIRDGGAVTGVGRWTPITATVGNGGLTPSDLGAVEEWLAFNTSVRRAGERKGRLSFSSRGGLERDGDDSPRSRVGSLPSSEAETRGAVESLDGSPRARRRSPRGSEGVRMGRVLGFFESFPFFQIGRRP